MMIIESHYQSHEMACCSHHNENMENLMAAAPDIEPSGSPLLRYSRRVQARASDVQHAFQHDPTKTDTFAEMSNTVQLDAMQHGEDG